MGLKFTIVAAIFQVLLIILFSVLVDYSEHALAPHNRKGATGTAHNTSETLPVNDVAIYYPSKTFFLKLFCTIFPNHILFVIFILFTVFEGDFCHDISYNQKTVLNLSLK